MEQSLETNNVGVLLATLGGVIGLIAVFAATNDGMKLGAVENYELSSDHMRALKKDLEFESLAEIQKSGVSLLKISNTEVTVTLGNGRTIARSIDEPNLPKDPEVSVSFYFNENSLRIQLNKEPSPFDFYRAEYIAHVKSGAQSALRAVRESEAKAKSWGVFKGK